MLVLPAIKSKKKKLALVYLFFQKRRRGSGASCDIRPAATKKNDSGTQYPSVKTSGQKTKSSYCKMAFLSNTDDLFDPIIMADDR